MSAHERHGPLVRHEQIHIADSALWRKLPVIGAVVGIAGLGIAVATASSAGADVHKAWFSYLTSVMFWLALSLGGLFFTLVQHAARAGWSIVVRRLAENAMLTLPLMGVLLLPVVFLGAHDLFHWTHADVVANDEVLQAKAGYLNEGAFRTRAIVYVALWSLMAIMFHRWSTRQDTAAAPEPFSHKMRFWSPLALFAFGLTLTFGAFDFLMSLDPHWFSTMFGVYYFAGCVVSIHSLLAMVAISLQRSGYLRGVVTKEHYHDIGKYMFAFTVFWAYIGFSQYFLIWYASIPEETYWFSYRGHGDYLYLSILMVFVRFAIPFVGIMSRRFKRNTTTLMFWAVWMLVGQLIDMYWLVQPALAHARDMYEISIDLFDVTTFLGVGGLWVAMFGWALARSALVPVKDPRLAESLVHENF